MKFLLTFACAAIYIAIVNGASLPDDVKEKVMEIKKECLAEHPNIDHDHLEKLKKHEFVEGDEELKKFVLCFHLKTKMQNEDGSYNVEHMKEKIAKIFGNHDHDKDVEECTKDDHHDAVENAWALVKCIKPKLGKVDE